MRFPIFALAASSIFAGGVAARGHAHHRRHGHFPRSNGGAECPPPLVPRPCTTIVKTILVEHTVPVQQTSVAPATEVQQTTVYVQPTPSTTEIIEGPPTPDVPLPTQEVTTYETPGTYTIPEKTITVTSTEVVCGATHTTLPTGIHTIGGITTVVEQLTTIVCPFPVVEDSTTKIVTTTFVCPSSGTYTIGPITTTVTEPTDFEYPVLSTIPPATYVQPEFTITVTETSEVVTCPGYTASTVVVIPVPVPTDAPTEATDAPTEAPVTDKPTTENAPEPAPTTPEQPSTTVKAPEQAPTTEQASTTEKPTTSEKTSTTSSKAVIPTDHSAPVPNGAITYSPFNDDGTCKDAAGVEVDIADIASKGFKSIRIYAPECGALTSVADSLKKHQLKMIAGVFIKGDGIFAARDQVKKWADSKLWDIIDIIIIGNEVLLGQLGSASDLNAFYVESKAILRAAGFQGLVTTTESIGADYKSICQSPDLEIMGLNIHPFFDPNTDAAHAGDFINGKIKECETACGKPCYVFEAGWPKGGISNGKAIASPEAQAIAFQSIKSKCDMTIITVFTYRDDLWKNPGALQVERHFGCAAQF